MRQFCIGSGNQCDKNCKTASKINISHSYKCKYGAKSFHISCAVRIYYETEGGNRMEEWWEDLTLMRRLFRYLPESGMIYCKQRLPEDFYPTGEGRSFMSAEGAASKYNLERLGELAFNCRVKTKRSTCYYLNGTPAYKGKQKKLLA